MQHRKISRIPIAIGSRLRQILGLRMVPPTSDGYLARRLQQKPPARLLRNLLPIAIGMGEIILTISSTLKLRWLMVFMLLNACVDPIYFDAPPAQSLTVVDGFISDSPGPYTVKVSTGLSLNTLSSTRKPVEKAKIKLYDDEGNTEDFTESSPGVYMTGGIIQGQLGHSYHIVLETADGKIFESEPDRINPVGEVEQIKYEFEARTVQKSYGEVSADVFNIYVDAQAGEGDENYVRWRFTGTYKVFTFPELHMIFALEFYYKDPIPCSGVEVAPAEVGGKLVRFADCTCCTCWINQFESVPQVSDGQFIKDNQFRNVKVGEVPINSFTFYDQYLVEVEQMSLSKTSFEFFRLIRAQKEGASSLFQPPSGQIKGNVSPVNSTEAVVGLFWATSVKAKHLFITRSDVPYLLTPMDTIPNACTGFSNSSTDKPELWP